MVTKYQLTEDQDLTSIFLGNVLPIYPHIQAHRGLIKDITWDGSAVELLIDDASKQKDNFLHMLRTFGPSFIPELTRLVLMDFNMYRKASVFDLKQRKKRSSLKAQQRTMSQLKRHFEPIHSFWPRKSGEVFLYTRPFDFGTL